MRQIKFRAWIGSSMEYQVLAGILGNFFAYQDPKDTACAINTKYTETVPVMQYTGLNDKNGKEIYEGDILKLIAPCHDTHSDWQKENGNYEVVWSTYDLQWTAKGNCHLNWWSSVEVIGNIYENNDLTK